jgi:hypothetical protein
MHKKMMEGNQRGAKGMWKFRTRSGVEIDGWP